MDEVGKILPALFKKQMRRDEPHLLEILAPLWPRVAGKAIAQHSQPAFFASGVLTLTTDCATWGAQLRHMTEEIRAGINSYLGQPVVKKLRVKRVGQPGQLSLARRPGGTASPRKMPLTAALDTTAIADPEVESALASSYAKYFTRPAREN